MNPDTVTHPSTNGARRWLTLLIDTNALPLRQITTMYAECAFYHISEKDYIHMHT